MDLLRILTVLGINAIPALGWFLGEWNSGTTLAVYWIETLLASIFIALRIVIHRRRVRLRGHFCYETRQDSRRSAKGIPFLKHFLPVMLSFSAAHGIFLFALIFFMTANGRGEEVQLSYREVALGCGLIFALQIAEFLLDLVGLINRPFRWVERMAELNMGRVMVIQMTLMIGVLAGGLSGGTKGFFLAFVILKTMNDLSSVLPQYDPEEAPRWLCRLLDKIPNLGKSEVKPFGEYWREGKVGERKRREINEEPFAS